MSEQEEVQKKIVEKALAIKEMTSHPGWAYLMDACQGLINQEMRALTNQTLDNSYYKKIGFIQMYKYCKEIPSVIKDKEIRDYLLHQGRCLGADTFGRSPLKFIEGLQNGNKIIRDFFDKSQMELKQKEKQKYHEDNLA